MNIKILYDNRGKNESIACGWGFSCLVDNRVFFDAGESAELLKQNIENMGIDLASLEAVVISHDHWDHTGGLEYVARERNSLGIYVCPGFDGLLKSDVLKSFSEVIKVDCFRRVSSLIYTTGQLTGSYKNTTIAEQALILRTDKGLSVITGCAHPGIINMLRCVKAQLGLPEFYAVIGGFHLKDHSRGDVKKIVDEFANLKVRNVAPLHCTGLEAASVFQEAYGKNCLVLKAGEELEV